MRAPLLITPLKWLLTLSLLGGLLFGLFLIHAVMRAERDREENEEKAQKLPQPRNGIVHLEKDEADRYGLATVPAQALQWHEQAIVYGRVVPNPRVTTDIRSPFAGTLRAAVDAAWPTPGRWVQAGQMLGWVDIRVGPDVRLDLQNKLADARVKQRGAEEEVKLQQDRITSLKAATSREIIARNELDAALVQLAQAQTQLATAKAAADLWHKAIQEVEHHKGDEHSLWSQPLTAVFDGEVTELAGRPGMSVESGALLIQLVDFRRPLIRLDFPPEIIAQGAPLPRMEVHVPALSTPALSGVLSASRSVDAFVPIQGHLVGPAPRVEAASQFVSYLYDARLEPPSAKDKNASGGMWRPGMQVTARLRAIGAAAQPAVAVPAGAVLYHQGRPLIYVRVDAEKYERRAVRLLGREGGCWIVNIRQGSLPIGIAANEVVVSRQAQVLLSTEFLVGTLDND